MIASRIDVLVVSLLTFASCCPDTTSTLSFPFGLTCYLLFADVQRELTEMKAMATVERERSQRGIDERDALLVTAKKAYEVCSVFFFIVKLCLLTLCSP